MALKRFLRQMICLCLAVLLVGSAVFAGVLYLLLRSAAVMMTMMYAAAILLSALGAASLLTALMCGICGYVRGKSKRTA